MKIIYLKNFRKGFATNSSSTHSVIYKNKEDMFKDLNVFELNYYGRFDETIAASKEAKIKYIAATIFYNKELFDIMCAHYPEMKQYAKLAEHERNYQDSTFGMYTRGALSFSNKENIAASIEFLKNIIDTDDIIIVGGSDEEDFVYETCSGHKILNTPDDLSYNSPNVYKNGNYYIGYGYDGKIRFSVSNEPCIPDYPELIDLKITNKCDHGCPFCYQGSSMSGAHANLENIKNYINQLSSVYDKKIVEFSIGGGNILLYPELDELFYYIFSHGHIINTTIKAQDCKVLKENKELRRTFNHYVKSIGISVSSLEDIKYLILIKDLFKGQNYKPIVIHLIPEYLGVEMTNKIITELDKNEFYKYLFLGYKENERGKTQKHYVFNDNDLSSIFENRYSVSVDTTFANKYKAWLTKNYAVKHTITYNEGEYSMYIDAVTGNAYKSSYQLDKPYNLNYGKREYYNIIKAFKNIRADNGFGIKYPIK